MQKAKVISGETGREWRRAGDNWQISNEEEMSTAVDGRRHFLLIANDIFCRLKPHSPHYTMEGERCEQVSTIATFSECRGRSVLIELARRPFFVEKSG